MSVLPLSIPSPDPSWQFFDLSAWLESAFGWALPFSFRIHAYAICILLGIIVAVIWTNRRLTRRGAEPWVLIDVVIWAVPLGLVGARLYHVFTHPSDYFYEGANIWNPMQPGSIWAIWEGGNAIFGALIGGAVGAWIGCRLSGLRFWTFADALAPGMLAAQALGRLGNWFNHELYGQPTDLPWGLEIEASNPAFPIGLPEGTLFHPTFLYEIIWNVIGIAVILYLERARPSTGIGINRTEVPRLQWGKVWALYLIWYGLGRSWLESIRVDPSEVFLGIRVNVWGALAAIALGVVLFIVQSRRHPGAEPSPYVSGREWNGNGAVDSETYSDSDDEDGAPGNDAARLIAEKAK